MGAPLVIQKGRKLAPARDTVILTLTITLTQGPKPVDHRQQKNTRTRGTWVHLAWSGKGTNLLRPALALAAAAFILSKASDFALAAACAAASLWCRQAKKKQAVGRWGKKKEKRAVGLYKAYTIAQSTCEGFSLKGQGLSLEEGGCYTRRTLTAKRRMTPTKNGNLRPILIQSDLSVEKAQFD